MWKQTYNLDSEGTLTIDQTVGRIHLAGWDLPGVEITASGDDPSRFLKVLSNPHELRVSVEIPRLRLLSSAAPLINLEVKVPPGLKLVVVDTGAGEVELDRLDARSLTVDSGVGQVSCKLSRIYPGGRYCFDAGAGAVAVEVPEDAGLDIVLDTGIGKVRSAVALADQRGTLNGGGATLVLDVGVGEVTLSLGPSQAARAVPATVQAPDGNSEHGALLDDGGRPAAEAADEVRRVLRMVEDGRLSPEDANEILRALEEGKHDE